MAFFRAPQGNVHPAVKGAAAATAVWLTVAITIVSAFEGFASKPYVDRVGTGHPETWCYGMTKAEGPPPPYSKVFTKAECQGYLGPGLQKYDTGIKQCIHVPMPPHREAAMVSAAYNLGVAGVCRSAMVRNLNAGHVQAACDALLQYNRAQGRVLAGLTRRRQQERLLCLMEN